MADNIYYDEIKEIDAQTTWCVLIKYRKFENTKKRGYHCDLLYLYLYQKPSLRIENYFQ